MCNSSTIRYIDPEHPRVGIILIIPKSIAASPDVCQVLKLNWLVLLIYIRAKSLNDLHTGIYLMLEEKNVQASHLTVTNTAARIHLFFKLFIIYIYIHLS